MTDNQMDLFRAARDDGMRRAVEHAERVEPSWGVQALDLVRLYAAQQSSFTTHELRAWAKSKHHFVGVTNWAWGSVMVRAVRLGIIMQTSTARVGDTVSHLKLSPVWRRP